ncbi:snoRNP complex protein nop56, partial [Mortierella antarctica]
CSIASRIDCFSESPTTKFGEAMKEQVEERLEFYESGATPSKNADTMKKVIDHLKDAAGDDLDAPVKAGKKRKADEEEAPAKKSKKEKSDKKEDKEDKKDKKEKKEKKDKKEKKSKK